MGLARLGAARRATDRISDWVVSLLRLTRIGVGRGLRQVTLRQQPPAFTGWCRSRGRLRSVMRSLLTNARPAFGGIGGGLSSGFGILRDLTTAALIGAAAPEGPDTRPWLLASAASTLAFS